MSESIDCPTVGSAADVEGVAQKASFITPVPGTVGPMTITMPLENTIAAAEWLS